MAERQWMRDLPAYTDKSVEHTVGDQPQRFYPLSADAAFQLRAVARPIGKVFSFLTSNDSQRDAGYVQNVFEDKKTGETNTRVETRAPTLELAQFRAKQREDSVDAFITGLLSDEVRGALGVVILDSLRDRSDTAPITSAEGLTFIKKMDLSVMISYLKGVGAANAEVFRPLAEMAGQFKGLAAEKLKGLATSPDAPAPPGSPSSPPSTDESAATASPSLPPKAPTEPVPAST